MLRAVHRKDDYIGYIFRLKGIDTFINGSSSFLIAMETDFAEWRFHDTRLDGSDFDVAVYDFDTDAVTESFYRGFGRTVDRGSGVSVESRRGTEVYDMPPVPLEHSGKEGTGHKEEPFDVCVDGLDDIIDIVAAVRFETSGKSCVIYEDIGCARFGKAAAGSVLYGIPISYIEGIRCDFDSIIFFKAVLDGIKFFLVSCGKRQIKAVFCKCFGGSQSDAAGRPVINASLFILPPSTVFFYYTMFCAGG